MALAAWFHQASWERMGNPLFLIPPAIAVLVPVGLILKEPNLGTAVITAVGRRLGVPRRRACAGGRWCCVLAALGAAAPLAYAHLHDYQRARITTFLNPESDPLGAGYNIIQSKIALGSGGMWGKGFLQGTQTHLNFLPEKQTDFVFTMHRRGVRAGRRPRACWRCCALITLGGDGDRAALPPSVRAAGGARHRA